MLLAFLSPSRRAVKLAGGLRLGITIFQVAIPRFFSIERLQDSNRHCLTRSAYRRFPDISFSKGRFSAAITAKDLMCARRQKLFATPKTAGDRNARFQMRSNTFDGDDFFLSAGGDDNLHLNSSVVGGQQSFAGTAFCYSAMRARPLANERGTRLRRAVETKRMYRAGSISASFKYSSRTRRERPFRLR